MHFQRQPCLRQNGFPVLPHSLVSPIPFLTSLAIATLIPGILLGLSSVPSLAQESSDCFMKDSTGRIIPLGGLCGPAPVRPPVASPSSVIQAQIKRRESGVPVIDVTFNGRHRFEMILDTGASGTVITRQMADQLQVQTIGVATASIADGSQVQFPVGYVNSIGVGRAVVTDVPVAIAENMPLGLLGHDFLDYYDVKIKRDVVEFYQRR